jgi:hypothetical protein
MTEGKRNYCPWPTALSVYRDESGGPDSCWPWLKQITPNGYGTVHTPWGTKYAHRAVYEQEVGPIPPRAVIDHACRVRHCVNPRHLRVMSQGQNLRIGLRGFDLTGRCQSGRHDVTDPASWHVDSRANRECAACREDRKQRQG